MNRGNCRTPKFALPFFTRNHSFRFSLIFQIGLRIGQTDFSYQLNPKLGFPLILNQSKQIIRVSIDLVEFGSGFDQADASLTINQELGFARAFSEEFESTVS